MTRSARCTRSPRTPTTRRARSTRRWRPSCHGRRARTAWPPGRSTSARTPRCPHAPSPTTTGPTTPPPRSRWRWAGRLTPGRCRRERGGVMSVMSDVPDGTVQEVLDWVGQDPGRAGAALHVEEIGAGRTTLLNKLGAIASAQPEEEPVTEDPQPVVDEETG